MAKVSAKRQITLPIEQCHVANIKSGDEVESYVDRQGIISIVKKTMGAANGLLKGIKVDSTMTDEGSLNSVLN